MSAGDDGLEPLVALIDVKAVLNSVRSTFSSNSLSGWLPHAANREANLEQAFTFIEEGYDYIKQMYEVGEFGPDDINLFNNDLVKSLF
jgi:hypothetical protein